MTIRIATPFSELFKRKPIRRSILRLSDVVELRDPRQTLCEDFLKIFHSELNLVALWSDADRSILEGICKWRHLKLISFHLASRYRQNLLRKGAFHGVGKPYNEKEMKAHARNNITFLRKTLRGEFPILAENNNDLGTDAYQIVTDGEFIAGVVEENNIGFLWDIAHSKITAHNRSIDHEAYLATLPLDRCVQVHLSAYGKRNGVAFDAHDAMGVDEWAYFGEQMRRLPHLVYATIEYYKDSTILQEQLRKLREIIEANLNG